MANKNAHKTIKVNASAEDAMKKISQVNKWWAKKVKGKTEKLNDKFTVDFGETLVDFQISQIIPNKKVVWKVTDCNLHWINNNKMETKLFLQFLKRKIQNCEVGWTEHITVSLVKFINEGKGMPV